MTSSPPPQDDPPAADDVPDAPFSVAPTTFGPSRRGRRAEPMSQKIGPSYQALLERLRHQISAQGITLEELARRTGVQQRARHAVLAADRRLGLGDGVGDVLGHQTPHTRCRILARHRPTAG